MLHTQRLEVLDVMKGIGILLMLVGHYTLPFSLNTVIYSFHMPLFFFVAGYLFRPQEVGKQLKRDTKRLIVPYLIGEAIFLFAYLLYTTEQDLFSMDAFSRMMFWVLVGPLWFLPAIFWCKGVFNILYQRTKSFTHAEWIFGVAVCAIALSAFALSAYVGVELPLHVSAGLVAMLFYYVGYKLRAYDFFSKPNPWLASASAIIWLSLAPWSSLQMVFIRYPWTPLGHVFVALCGTYLTFCISYYVMKQWQWGKDQLLFWGSSSLIVLVLHGASYGYMMQTDISIFRDMFTALGHASKGSSSLAYLAHIALIYLGAKYLPRTRLGRAIFV